MKLRCLVVLFRKSSQNIRVYPALPNNRVMRVVSLLPSAAEIICLVASPEVLVGRSHEDDYPPEIRGLPILTSARTTFTTAAEVDKQVSESLAKGEGLYDLDVVKLKELKPDAIVTQDLCNVCSIDLITVQRIAKDISPCPQIITLNPNSLFDVLSTITLVGDALGCSERAAKVRTELHQSTQEAISLAEKCLQERDGRRINVAFMEWTDPYYPGGHWTPQLIYLAGGEHPLNPATATEPAQPSYRIPTDQVLASQPTHLIICPCGLDLATIKHEVSLLSSKEWFQTLMKSCDKIALVDGNQMFNRPGPRLLDALWWLVGFLNDMENVIPENFPWERIK